MTAPAAVTPTAPAAAPAAPATEAATTAPSVSELKHDMRQESGRAVDRFMKKALARPVAPDPAPTEGIAEALIGEAPAETPAPIGGLDTQTLAPAPESTGPANEGGTPQDFATEIVADDPDAALSLRARDPQTGQFSELDQSRTYELSIKDKATGERKVYEKTLPELMRMARDGVSARQQLAELNHYRNEFGKWQNTHQGMTQRLQAAEQNAQRLEAYAVSLLTDPPEQVDRQRAQYAQEFTPDKQIARLQAELERARNAPPAQPVVPQVSAEQRQQATSTLTQRVGQVVEQATQVVGEDAAMGKAMRDLRPLFVNGQIPVEHFQQVENYLTGPYAQWVQEQAASKNAATAKAQEVETARQQVKAEQARAQKAARLVGTATRPSAVSQGAAPAGPQITPRSTMQDRIAAIVRRPTASG